MQENMICNRCNIVENISESFTLQQKDEITDINKFVQNHLQLLRDLLGNYFSDLNDFDYKLIRNLFGLIPDFFHTVCKMN